MYTSSKFKPAISLTRKPVADSISRIARSLRGIIDPLGFELNSGSTGDWTNLAISSLAMMRGSAMGALGIKALLCLLPRCHIGLGGTICSRIKYLKKERSDAIALTTLPLLWPLLILLLPDLTFLDEIYHDIYFLRNERSILLTDESRLSSMNWKRSLRSSI